MLGLLVIIVVSWVLLHFIEKKSINVLGILPIRIHIIQFLIGLVFIVIITLLTVYFETVVKSVDWKMNSINYRYIYDAFIYHLKSALTEDLVFRGALLYIFISRFGAKWGILISALTFGVYHVFSYGMLNERIVPILYVILVTGTTGYAWAYTFYKTKSIFMGLGFHVGSNMILTFFYPSQPYGELLFSIVSKVNLSEWNELYYALFKGLFPSIITVLFVKYLAKPNLNILQKD